MSSSPWRVATIALMVLLMGVLLHTFGDYGMSWDEYYRQKEGAKKLAYYQNLFSGHYAPYSDKQDLYPGFYDLLHQGVNLISPMGPVTTDHLLTALFAWLAVWGAYHLGRRLGNEKIGFLAALFTVLFPHFYGHAFINPKDIPFAAGFIWSLYYIIKSIDSKLGVKHFLKLGICIGITTATRAGGVMLMAYLLGAFICRMWLLRHTEGLWKEGLKYGAYWLGACLLAFVVMLPFWPYAHPHPFTALVQTVTEIAHYPWNGAVLFNGQIYAATDLPWYYLPEMLIITTPEFYLLLSLIGLGFGATKLFSGLKSSGIKWFCVRRLKLAFLIGAMLLPIAVVCIRSATLYDGIRHFLFTLPIWAVLLAVAFDRLTRLPKPKKITNEGLPTGQTLHFGSQKKLVVIGLWSLLTIHTLAIAADYAVLHPYQYTYYNHIVGTTTEAWKNFETEYWGTSHREAVEKLVAHLKKEGDNSVHTVTSPMAPWLVQTYLPKNLVYTADSSQAEFYISFTRFRADLWSDGKYMPDCIVSRKGAPFAVVRDRREIIKNAQKYKPSPLVSGILGLLPAL